MKRSWQCPRGITLAHGLMLIVTAPLAAQDAYPLRSSYWTVGAQFQPRGNDFDLLVYGGPMRVTTPAGRWMTRLDGLAGMTFYGNGRQDSFGYLTGLQAAVARVWTGDYLGLEENGYSVEFYAVAGGGGYYAWRLEEIPDWKGIVPVISAGGGMRFRGSGPDSELVSFEVLREERLGAPRARIYLRFGAALPVGRSVY